MATENLQGQDGNHNMERERRRDSSPEDFVNRYTSQGEQRKNIIQKTRGDCEASMSLFPRSGWFSDGRFASI